MEQITIKQMHDHCDEQGLDVSIFDGLDAAIIGLASQGPKDVAVYSYDKLIGLLMETNEWSETDAVEWFEFNMTGYFDGAPIVMHMQVLPDAGERVNAHGTG